MWRWIARIVAALCAVLLTVAALGAGYQWFATRRELTATPPPGTLVDVGGHRLHIWCMGSGSPAVILEGGLGGTFAGWGFVQPEVARFTRTCSYDRAGMGYSDPGPSPRTTQRASRELAKLLDGAGISSPVVLAGASLGGFTVRVFASEYPGRAAGLVLVDASHEDQQHDIPPLAPYMRVLSTVGVLRFLGMSVGLSPETLAPPVRHFAHATRFRAAAQQAAADEILRIHESVAEVRNTRRKLTIPVVVVTAGRGVDRVWSDLQRDQLRLSDRACQIFADQSGHAVPLDQPEVVVAAIRAVVDAARGQDLPLCR